MLCKRHSGYASGRLRRRAALLLPLALAACVERGLGNTHQEPGSVVSYPQSVARAVDLLLVIDSSGSMDDEMAMPRAYYTVLFHELRSAPGGLPDLHVGVTSMDLGAGDYGITYCEDIGGDGGRLLTGGCSNPLGARLLVDVAPQGCAISRAADDTCTTHTCTPSHCAHEPSTTLADDSISGCPRCRNYEGQELEDAVSCLTGLGTFGCGFEQPLEAMHRALDGSNPENVGFLREDAILGILLLTDEDDCSAADPRLFDPSETAIDSYLGPLTSFRCFEFGVTCDVNDRLAIGPRTGCVPREDPDALLHPVSRYVDFLRWLKDDQMLVLAAIAGPVAPSPTGPGAEVDVARDEFDQPEVQYSCIESYGGALPGVRLRSVVAAFHPEEAPSWAYTSQCAPTYSDALAGMGAELRRRLEAPCLPAPLEGCADPGAEHGAPRDADASNDTCRASCEVIDVKARGMPEEARREVPPCLEVCPVGHCRGNTDRALAYRGGHPPLRDPGLPVEACFHVGWNPRCEASNHGELLVARRVDPPPRTFAEVGCVYAPQTERLCADGLDNDGDGLVDGEDPDCHW